MVKTKEIKDISHQLVSHLSQHLLRQHSELLVGAPVKETEKSINKRDAKHR